MGIIQTRIFETRQKLNISKKVNRILFMTVVISILINAILVIQLTTAFKELNKPQPIIMGTGTMEKVGDNMYQIVEDKDFEEIFPPISSIEYQN